MFAEPVQDIVSQAIDSDEPLQYPIEPNSPIEPRLLAQVVTGILVKILETKETKRCLHGGVGVFVAFPDAFSHDELVSIRSSAIDLFTHEAKRGSTTNVTEIASMIAEVNTILEKMPKKTLDGTAT